HRARVGTFLRPGLLVHGFLRVRCDDCAFERLVPLSCKGRAVCTSCGGRRGAGPAADLIPAVLPRVPPPPLGPPPPPPPPPAVPARAGAGVLQLGRGRGPPWVPPPPPAGPTGGASPHTPASPPRQTTATASNTSRATCSPADRAGAADAHRRWPRAPDVEGGM